jgi:hypothetical protein
MASGGGIGAFPGNVGDRRVGYFPGLPRETEARERILRMWLAPAMVMAFLRPIISPLGTTSRLAHPRRGGADDDYGDDTQSGKSSRARFSHPNRFQNQQRQVRVARASKRPHPSLQPWRSVNTGSLGNQWHLMLERLLATR